MADEGAGELEDSGVDVGASFVAGAEACELVQPGKNALNDPTHGVESGPVIGVFSSDAWSDSLVLQGFSVMVAVVTAVTVEPVRPLSGPTTFPSDRQQFLNQRNQLLKHPASTPNADSTNHIRHTNHSETSC